MMKRFVATVIVMLCAAAAVAEDARPRPVLARDLVWVTSTTNAAIQMAWMIGAEPTPGPYIFRVKLSPGARIPPHSHPDTRNSTVLSGTIYVGFGEVFDEATMVAVPTGAVYVAPANVPHFVWAKDGEAVYQEAGVGPTASVPVNRLPVEKR